MGPATAESRQEKSALLLNKKKTQKFKSIGVIAEWLSNEAAIIQNCFSSFARI